MERGQHRSIHGGQLRGALRPQAGSARGAPIGQVGGSQQWLFDNHSAFYETDAVAVSFLHTLLYEPDGAVLPCHPVTSLR